MRRGWTATSATGPGSKPGSPRSADSRPGCGGTTSSTNSSGGSGPGTRTSPTRGAGARLERRPACTVRDGERFLDAAQNARLIANAEEYYPAMYTGRAESWNL